MDLTVPHLDKAWFKSEQGIRAIAVVLTALTLGLSFPKHVNFGYWAESPAAWVVYLLLSVVITYWLTVTLLREFTEEVTS